MPHILTTFNENTHTCERSAIKKDERENIQNIFVDLLSFFPMKNSSEQKLIFYGDL